MGRKPYHLPKDADQANVALSMLVVAWESYREARPRYSELREMPRAGMTTDERIALNKELTSTHLAYTTAFRQLKQAHKNWKAIFRRMDQERQL